MATFGFTTAVTTLGHHGTGLTNFQVGVTPPCTLEEVCSKLEQILAGITLILECCKINQANILNIGNVVNGVVAKQGEHDERFNVLFQLIVDFRRELLRGNRDIRR